MECIPRVGAPTSIVRMPVPPAVIGPIVLPQPISLRTTKDCTGTSSAAASMRKNPEVSLLDA